LIDRMATFCGVLAVSLALAGCVVAPSHEHRHEMDEVVYGPVTSVYVRVAPPAPRVEYRGYAPATGYVWIDGYWNWGGVSYLWVPGRWVAPRPGYVWMPHRWSRDGDRWRSEGGRWETDRSPAPPRREWEREPGRARESERPREVSPPPLLQPRPWRQEVSPAEPRRAEPETETRRHEMRRRHEGEPREAGRQGRQGKDEDWRKGKESDD